MDPLRALEVGARSGVFTSDADDFVARMDMVPSTHVPLSLLDTVSKLTTWCPE